MTTLLIESKTGPPAADAEERDYISYSAIRSFLQCSLRYYFRYVAKLPEERIGASLVFGNAIHGALELHFRRLLEGDVAPSLAEMLAAYQAGCLSTRIGAERCGTALHERLHFCRSIAGQPDNIRERELAAECDLRDRWPHVQIPQL